jgi:hypothetical protein
MHRATAILWLTLLSGCTDSNELAPDRASPELGAIDLEAHVTGSQDPRTGAFFDYTRQMVRRIEGNEVVDLSSAYTPPDFYEVRLLEDGTIWLGTDFSYESDNQGGVLARHRGTGPWETIDLCAAAEPDATSSFDVRGPDDVWVVNSWVDGVSSTGENRAELCHIEGSAATREELPFAVFGIVAAPSALYVVGMDASWVTQIRRRAEGSSTWETFETAEAGVLMPLGDGVLFTAGDSGSATTLHAIDEAGLRTIGTLPEGELAYGGTLEDLWAVQWHDGEVTDRCYLPLSGEWSDCPRQSWQQHVAFHFDGSSFAEMGHVDCDSAEDCDLSPIALPDGRLVLINTARGEASFVEP